MTMFNWNNTSKNNPGFIQDIILRAKLIYYLMGDKRISGWLKMLPVGAFVYLISPLDFPLGPIDDAAVIGLASYLFIELCPANVVQEYLQKLGLSNATRRNPKMDEELIIDGEIVETDDKK